jgi:hypothetical protein
MIDLRTSTNEKEQSLNRKKTQIGDKNVKPCYYQVYIEANRTQLEITSHIQLK